MGEISVYDLLIIGAGPAGLTAGLYAGRYRLNCAIFEALLPGGQILLSPTIENYPGFPGGISTDELVANMKKQVDDLGVEIKQEAVSAVTADVFQAHPVYSVKSESGEFKARTLIIASGAHWKKLGVPGEEKLIGRGVSYCGTCDAPLFRDKEIVVVGGGDKAIEEAIYLTKYASKVTLVHRRQGFRAAQILVEKARENPKINFVLDSRVESIFGESKVSGVVIKNTAGGAVSNIDCAGVFIFVGVSPNTDFIHAELARDSGGFIETDNAMATSLQGVFACGDCRSKTLYQVISACGEGAVAGNSAHTYLIST